MNDLLKAIVKEMDELEQSAKLAGIHENFGSASIARLTKFFVVPCTDRILALEMMKAIELFDYWCCCY